MGRYFKVLPTTSLMVLGFQFLHNTPTVSIQKFWSVMFGVSDKLVGL